MICLRRFVIITCGTRNTNKVFSLHHVHGRIEPPPLLNFRSDKTIDIILRILSFHHSHRGVIISSESRDVFFESCPHLKYASLVRDPTVH